MFIVRQMMGRKLEFQQESSWDFPSLERAHDKINREMIPPVIRQHHVPEELISPLLFVILLDYISNGAQWSEDRRLFMLMTSYWESTQQRNYNKQ